MCCILDENHIETESCLSMHTFDHTYTFHRTLIEPGECLQEGTFQRSHDPFFKKRVLYQHFSNLIENTN